MTENGYPKFCSNCGARLLRNASFCSDCGHKVEFFAQDQTQQGASYQNNQGQPIHQTGYEEYREPIIINNNFGDHANYVPLGKRCNKWVAFFLCLFLGIFGAHKFYEGKIGMGILYLLTWGLFCVGFILDLIVILCKPTVYFP